ncbi:MAG: cell envelope biogenesis protein TolA [Sphingomonadaceae bacterium]
MDRAEAAGLGIAAAGHLALIAALSLGLASASRPSPQSAPIAVSFVEDVGLLNSAPVLNPSSRASEAPVPGLPEDAAPASAESVALADPAPSLPAATQAEPRPAPLAERPAAAKPASRARPKRSASSGGGSKREARGSRLGDDFLKGLGDDPKAASAAPPAAVMDAAALAGIEAAIRRQVQPCADRQVNPGPGANRIRVTLNLRLARDGSLASPPRVVSTSGVDEENRRYEERVKDLAIATYRGCAPLKGLPAELYRTPRGGWSNINMSYKLPG